MTEFSANLRERRRARVYAAYEEASHDPEFMSAMNSELASFDFTLADGCLTQGSGQHQPVSFRIELREDDERQNP